MASIARDRPAIGVRRLCHDACGLMFRLSGVTVSATFDVDGLRGTVHTLRPGAVDEEPQA
jgi:hypothetical protein